MRNGEYGEAHSSRVVVLRSMCCVGVGVTGGVGGLPVISCYQMLAMSCSCS